MKLLLNLVWCAVLSNTAYSYVPNLSRKCKLSDSGCLIEVAQRAVSTIVAGIAELDTEPLDVMYINKSKIDVAGLKLTVTDTYLKGLKKAVINNIRFDMTKYIMKLTYRTDMDMKAKYKSSGQLLILPINGDGDISINLENLYIDMRVPFEIIDNESLELKSYEYDYEVKGGMHFNVTNLFEGNKELTKTLLTFMNENWKTLSVTFGRPMLDNVQEKIFSVLKTFFRSQPLNYFVEI